MVASSYDAYFPRPLYDEMRGRLTYNQVQDWQEALELLLLDPTEGNPHVTDASSVHGYQMHEYVMVWGELTITYRFLNSLVIQILAVRALPRLASGEPDL